MQINREDAIEKMAEAIRIVNLYGQNDGHEYIEGSRKLAEAALVALVGYLPEIIKGAEFPRCPSVQDYLTPKIINNSEKLYQELKSWGKK